MNDTISQQNNFTDKKPKILLIDDEQIMLDAMHEILLMDGNYESDMKGSAREAILKLQQDTYNLIVSDIRMPGMSGYDLYEWVAKHKPEIVKKIVFTSGDPYDPETKKFLEKTHNPCLIKPFKVDEFLFLIAQTLKSA